MERPESLPGERRGRRAPRLRVVSATSMTQEERAARIAVALNNGVRRGEQREQAGPNDTSLDGGKPPRDEEVAG